MACTCLLGRIFQPLSSRLEGVAEAELDGDASKTSSSAAQHGFIERERRLERAGGCLGAGAGHHGDATPAVSGAAEPRDGTGLLSGTHGQA